MAGETQVPDELIEVRCRSCGMYLGHRRRAGRDTLWCSEECADTPMAKSDETQERDEVIIELFLSGMGLMDISRVLGDFRYQYIQHALARRGLNEKKAS